MNKKLIILLTLLIFLAPCYKVYAEGTNENNLDQAVNDVIEGMDLTPLEDWLHKIFNVENVKEVIIQAIKGEYLSIEEMGNALKGSLKSVLGSLSALFMQVLSIIVICSVLSSIRPDNGQIKDLIFLVCYCSVCLSVFTVVTRSIARTKETINELSAQIDGVFPIALTIMSALGAKSSSTVYQPLYIGVSTLFSGIIKNVLFPIVEVCACVALFSSLGERFSLKKFLLFLSDAFKWIVGITVTVFSFLSIIKSISASTYDSFSIRALKYTIGNSFPLISGFAKEGIDVVFSSAILIKNAVGSLSIILLFFALLSPFLEVLLLSLFLKLLPALCEPIADNRITQLLLNFSKVIGMLATLLIMIFIIYFIVLFLVIMAQNGLVL